MQYLPFSSILTHYFLDALEQILRNHIEAISLVLQKDVGP